VLDGVKDRSSPDRTDRIAPLPVRAHKQYEHVQAGRVAAAEHAVKSNLQKSWNRKAVSAAAVFPGVA
jgi:hypothetical protein